MRSNNIFLDALSTLTSLYQLEEVVKVGSCRDIQFRRPIYCILFTQKMKRYLSIFLSTAVLAEWCWLLRSIRSKRSNQATSRNYKWKWPTWILRRPPQQELLPPPPPAAAASESGPRRGYIAPRAEIFQQTINSMNENHWDTSAVSPIRGFQSYFNDFGCAGYLFSIYFEYLMKRSKYYEESPCTRRRYSRGDDRIWCLSCWMCRIVLFKSLYWLSSVCIYILVIS